MPNHTPRTPKEYQEEMMRLYRAAQASAPPPVPAPEPPEEVPEPSPEPVLAPRAAPRTGAGSAGRTGRGVPASAGSPAAGTGCASA